MRIRQLSLLLLFGLFLTNAHAQSPKMTRNIYHMELDNDILKFKNQTDFYYSFGVFVAYHRGLDPDRKIKRALPFSGRHKKFFYNFRLGLQGFTPREEEDSLINDRPFAGVLALQANLSEAHSRQFLRIGLETGVRGPAAKAGEVQNWLHRVIDNDPVPGWEDQLDNQLILNVYGTYVRSFPVIEKHIEFLSQSEVALGTYETYFQQGFLLRLGLFNNLDNTSFYFTNAGEGTHRKNFEAYLTGHLYGRIQAYDATLSEEVNEQLDVKNVRAGYRISANININRFGFVFAYAKLSPNANVTLRHSYGTMGFNFRW